MFGNGGAGMGAFGVGIGEAFGAVNAARNTTINDYEQYRQREVPTTKRGHRWTNIILISELLTMGS